jgi:uncharacterized protein with HEPN domain
MNRDPSYLLDIHKYAQDILLCVDGIDEATFTTDLKTQYAVLYGITILGEAVKRLSPEFRSQNPQIPWKQIAGMRDKLIHDYRQINILQVWQVTQTSIPDLITQIQPLLPPPP